MGTVGKLVSPKRLLTGLLGIYLLYLVGQLVLVEEGEAGRWWWRGAAKQEAAGEEGDSLSNSSGARSGAETTQEPKRDGWISNNTEVRLWIGLQQCSAVQCSAVQCSAVQCRADRFAALLVTTLHPTTPRLA
jgi:hypothetical protein